jgi:hypothetical protein
LGTLKKSVLVKPSCDDVLVASHTEPHIAQYHAVSNYMLFVFPSETLAEHVINCCDLMHLLHSTKHHSHTFIVQYLRSLFAQAAPHILQNLTRSFSWGDGEGLDPPTKSEA